MGVQGSVHAYDPATGSGQMILDDGRVVDLPAAALAGSGLRIVRVGQRLSLTVTDPDSQQPEVTRAWLVGIGDGEIIR